MRFHYDHPRPALTVDVVVFGYQDARLQVLLIERGREPFKGAWALPGGFVRMEETLEEAARRELEEEAGVADMFLEQLYTFGDPGRDPRERVVSVAYYGLVKPSRYKPVASSDAANARWFLVDELPELAFDHRHILDTAIRRIQGKFTYEPLGFELLPESFTLSELQQLYETVLGRALDKRNFRKKILSLGIVTELGKKAAGTPYRAPMLYRFDLKTYRKLKRTGFSFGI